MYIEITKERLSYMSKEVCSSRYNDGIDFEITISVLYSPHYIIGYIFEM